MGHRVTVGVLEHLRQVIEMLLICMNQNDS